jgi:hypothetical protein
MEIKNRISAFPVHKTIWWKGAVRLQNDWVIPLRKERCSYDPFDYYHSTWKVRKSDGMRRVSLLHRFLAINPNEDESILKFCEEFGVLGDTQLEGFKDYEQRISTFIVDVMHKTSVFKPKAKSRDKERLQRFFQEGYKGGSTSSGLGVLYVPIRLDQFRYRYEEFKKAFELVNKVNDDPRSTGAQKIRGIVMTHFRKKLSCIRPSLTWDENAFCWATHWEAISLEAVLYLMLLFDLQKPGQSLQCPR